ncbi:DUF3892 domain-containing protein [Halobacterium salinarum]|jgi:hypothetical protein|uniref:DUF3892 domain-containing protein n=1 Tax=Halobacterium salinarum TaxID=2242 RepID=UPI0025553C17|nr:DUF3892 domain-containing protein [Halobacterium salinarum]MDL0134869.1 DUF3892 domain-containing protein [Halobacterium salinarum]
MAWGDYAIVAVRYDYDHSRIVKVKRRKVADGHLESPTEEYRQTVVDDLENNIEYNTAFKNDEGNWDYGEDLHILEIEGEKFLRTDQNDEGEDNLGGLPEF